MRILPASLCLMFHVFLVMLFPGTARSELILPSVSIEIIDTNIALGENFDILVVADVLSSHPVYGNDQITVFGFDINFSTGLELLGVDIGSGFTDNSSLLADTDVSGAVPFSPDASLTSGEDILLACLHFKAIQTGVYTVNIISDIGNLNQGLFTSFFIPSHDMTTAVDLTVLPVPAPGSMVLILLGGLGLWTIRNKKPLTDR